MNPTIEKIISMLFEDIIETEETHALHDEILNNCQERYQDMIARGVSEDEAIHAVMESLTGMDEVLAQYPRKTHEDEEGSSFCFDPARSPVRLVDIHLVSEDVRLSPSADGLVHIVCDEPGHIRVSHENGVLRVERGKARAVPRSGRQGLAVKAAPKPVRSNSAWHRRRRARAASPGFVPGAEGMRRPPAISARRISVFPPCARTPPAAIWISMTLW